MDFSTELEVRGDFNLVLVEDSVNYVRIEAGSKLMDQLITKVEFQRLVIENTNTCNWVRSYKIPKNIELHCSSLERIKINGEEITEEFVCGFVSKNKSFFEENQLSFFEMTVGLAFDYFQKEKTNI